MSRHIENGWCVFLASLGLMAGASGAAIIQTGEYYLYNHPDGSQIPPPYGLRLDELFNATSGHDVFTFDFNHPQSDMRLVYNGTTITISGVAWGGRDIGNVYANDVYLGLYTVHFVYNLGVQMAPGDDDVLVNTTDMSNFGTIVTPLGPIALTDKRGSEGYSFRLGDEDNDLGHRGYPGISGWGWVVHGGPGASWVPYSDWIFTAVWIPAPGCLTVFGIAAACGRRRRC